MAAGSVAFQNARVIVNGTDLSAYIRELGVNISAEALEDSAMGDTYRSRIGGPRDWAVSMAFNQDFIANGPHDIVIDALGTSACIEIRPFNACSTASNPDISGIGILTSFDPIAGSWGTLLTAPIQFMGKGAPTFSTAAT